MENSYTKEYIKGYNAVYFKHSLKDRYIRNKYWLSWGNYYMDYFNYKLRIARQRLGNQSCFFRNLSQLNQEHTLFADLTKEYSESAKLLEYIKKVESYAK